MVLPQQNLAFRSVPTAPFLSRPMSMEQSQMSVSGSQGTVGCLFSNKHIPKSANQRKVNLGTSPLVLAIITCGVLKQRDFVFPNV